MYLSFFNKRIHVETFFRLVIYMYALFIELSFLFLKY